MLACLAFVACSIGAVQNEIFVGPTGLDTNPGTSQKPLATLTAARDKARAIRCHTIVVKGGEYRLEDSLKLDAADSGLTLISAPKSRPTIVGAVDVPAKSAHRSIDATVLDRIIDPNARQLVYEVDLAGLGIHNLPPLQPRGFPHSGIQGPNELFQGNQAMTLARWPNKGYAKVGKVTEPGNGEHDQNKPKRKPVFSVGDRPKQWILAEEPWMYGYWKFDWADESIRIHRIDAGTGEITLSGPAVYGVDPGVPFFAENLLEELDAPGEYYIDRAKGKLYFIPIRPIDPKSPIRLSILGQPLIDVADASNVTVKGIDFGFSRGDAVAIRNCEHVRFEGCRFSNLGAKAASVSGGHDSGLRSCDISDTGEGGVQLSGGDRNTLAPGRNYVENCEFSNFERRSQTYRPAVWIDGVGNRVSHCYMHDAPHSAIIYGGNDHVIEFNRFSKLLSLTGDGGVVYTGRNWTARGTSIRNNWFEADFGQRKWEPAIYVDDLGSGIEMVGNLIEKCHWGFLIGGGRDNIMRDNLVVDCDEAFRCDARGLGWAASSRPTMEAGLKAVPYESSVWRTKYPNLPNILNENPMAPAGNVLEGNLLIRSGALLKGFEAPFTKTAKMSGNQESTVTSDQILAQIKAIRAKAGLIPDASRRQLK